MSIRGPKKIKKFITFDMELEKIGNKITVKGKPQKSLKPTMVADAQNAETESGNPHRGCCLTNGKDGAEKMVQHVHMPTYTHTDVHIHT